MRKLRLGTRSSKLALAQAHAVAAALGDAEVVPLQSVDLGVADKSRWVRGVERALLDGEIDLGVHSAKDVPADLPDGLALLGVPAREDPTDAFVGAATSFAQLAHGARVGTASLRRGSQLRALRPDLEVVECRGNVDTRLAKLAAGEYDGIVLATAGLVRLGREAEIAFRFALETMTPAPGQGSLAVEGRAGEAEAEEAAGRISDLDAVTELTAERAAVRALGASCETPVGVCARLDRSELEISAYAGLPDGSEWVRDRVRGDTDQPVALGEALAERMLAAGAGEILERAGARA